MGYKEEFINFLVESGALRFGEFTTKSGRKSPYFINAGSFRFGSHIEKLGGFYADSIMSSIKADFDILFGPAYKGIPLAVAAVSALFRNYGVDKQYCFNRKEVKDHGEGGAFVGAALTGGEKLILIEDVVTAGTAVREIVPQIKSCADVILKDMFILVDRMEIGYNGKTAAEEIYGEFGITLHPIVTVREIIDHLYNREINGVIALDAEKRDAAERYLEMYCVK